MAHLPTPGTDEGTWGDILNEFLLVEHNADGTLKKAGQIQAATDTAAAAQQTATDAQTAVAGKVAASIVTTKGDLIAATGNAAVARRAVGTDGQALVADSTQATGLNWATVATGGTVLLKANNLSDLTTPATARTNLGLGNVDNTSDANKPVSTATQTALNGKEPTITAGSTAQYWRGDKSWQTLDKTAVGLANVNNTSDINKPVSTATQTAINAIDDNAIAYAVALG